MKSIEERSATDLFSKYSGWGGEPKDAKFRAIVDMLVAYMLQNKIAPDDIRDAAFVASIQYMNLQPVRDLMYVRDDLSGKP